MKRKDTRTVSISDVIPGHVPTFVIGGQPSVLQRPLTPFLLRLRKIFADTVVKSFQISLSLIGNVGLNI
jgi:hypothetical protein